MSAPGSRWLGRRYLFQVGTLRIPTYAALLYLGSVAGIAAGATYAARTGLDARRFAFCAIGLLIPALLGARLWYVAQNSPFFCRHPGRIIRPLEGGAAQDGGLILSVLLSIPILQIAAVPFGRFWDAAAVTLLVGTVITRFGCLMNGCCAGRPTSSFCGVMLPNYRGEWRRRFPTQMLEAGLSLALLAGVALATRADTPPGAIFGGCLVGYACVRPLIALTRETDDWPRMMRVSLGVSLVLMAAGVFLLVPRR